jgi:mono/diheme cytochrome c family protein
MNKERFFSLLTATAVVAALYGTLCGHSVAAFKTNPQPLASAGVDAVALFGEKCAMCHGKNGAGQANWKAKGQPDFTNAEWQKSHSDAQIAEAIANGKGKYMKAYKDLLSAEEISALVARIRAFSKKK